MSSTTPSTQVVIIGAGIGGLSMGIALKRKLKLHEFKIFELSGDVGGTWHHNTYPGCASDTDTHWYSLSTNKNPFWKKTQVSQIELKEYWKGLAEKYSLPLILNREVVSVDWDNSKQLYKVSSKDSQTQAVFEDSARVVISAIGVLNVPSFPRELEGIRDFKGSAFHSAQWDHSIDLKNKRVALASSQLIPIISEDPSTEVVNFCRSSHWFLDIPVMAPISATMQMIFAHIPFVMRFYRMWIMFRNELLYLFLSVRQNWLRALITKQFEGCIKNNAPLEYHSQLIPKRWVGCKRLIIGTGYLSALHRPNFDLNYDGISKITDDGLITKKGKKFTFDVIIFATGFVTDKYPLNVRGIAGETVQEYYDRKGGPEAYLGVSLPGFPNFFMILGPNTVTSHGSVLFTEEVQAEYLIQLIRPIIQGHVTSVEVTPEANEVFNTAIQQRLEGSMWSSCTSWYRLGHQGKIVTQWPGYLTEYWWRLRRPIWRDYHMTGRNGWKPNQDASIWIVILGLGGLVLTSINWAANK
ncbi:hypothetical protein NLI96_g177 [Meripilus lineatus]|uniref:Monooxygenase n=1 Tax=Meripilus lineatus TaxID=2056292 RepID=A0AAD5YIQ3_9APHY|nr:hypothetical protein NLI96_g177 [Physisporinus lineatus]